MLNVRIFSLAFFFIISFKSSFSTEIEAQSCEERNTNITDNEENREPIIYKYDKERGKCGILGTESHCPDNMEFYFADGLYGFCNCKGLNTIMGGIEFADLSSKLIYHSETDQCYFIFSQGPCPSKQVVGYDSKTNKLICEHNPCHKFPPGSFYFNGYCYKENAICGENSQDVIKFVRGYKYPRCIVDQWIDSLNPINQELNKYQKNCYIANLDKHLKFEEGFEEYHSPEKMFCRASLKIKEPEFYNSQGTSSNEKRSIRECNARNPEDDFNFENPKYRYDNKRKRCSKVGERSHCPKNMVFFQKGWEDKFEGLGYCDCKHMEYNYENKLDYSTRFVYDPQTDQCYKIFSKESCPKNHWVSVDHKTGFKKCNHNPCHNKKDNFLFEENCYKIGESCGDLNFPNIKIERNMIFLKYYLYPHCFTTRIVPNVVSFGEAAGFIDNAKDSEKNCEDGTFLNIKNECQPAFDF